MDLAAPVHGHIVPLSSVPDPIFAENIVGAGIAVETAITDQPQMLVAPCSAKVSMLHPHSHAVMLTTETGQEILLHIGIDTVLLKGEGFTPQIKVGDTVGAGENLIEFNAAIVAQRAASLHTMMVVTNSCSTSTMTNETGRVTAGAPCLRLAYSRTALPKVKLDRQQEVLTSEVVLLPNPAGLHARPSANLVAEANKFNAEIQVLLGDRKANARSLVSLLGLGSRLGDEIRVQASGPDAEEAIIQLSQAIRNGLGEACGKAQSCAATNATPLQEEQPLLGQTNDDPNTLSGVAASPGLAIGQVFQLVEETFEFAEQGTDVTTEQQQLSDAIEKAKQQLQTLKADVISHGSNEQAAIFDAHRELLNDPELTNCTAEKITQGKSAPFSWQRTIHGQCEILSQLDNAVMAGRVADLEDVCKRVLRILLAMPEPSLTLPENTILVARDLTPSMTAKLDTNKVVGFATTEGGSSSHSAILARSMGIPAVAATDDKAQQLENGTNVVLDGFKGTLKTNVSDEEILKIRHQQEQAATQAKQDLAAKDKPAITSDGHQIEIVANIGNLGDSEKAMTLGGEGVGLLRSEFLFLDRQTAPSEEEQFETYQQIVKSQNGQPVIIRTLDVGGDKPLDYMPMPAEENPFLGERGIRIGINRPSILRTQVRAILRAAKENPESTVRIMFPMISTIEELRAAKAVVIEEANKLDVSNYEVGIMVEVPSTAVMADIFAREADFFSIGSNDLTQYTLAIDRGHPKLAAQVDGIHPSVLRLIEMTCKGAHKHGKWVGVCGGIASDTQAVPLLIGLGVDELSVSVPTLPAIKAQVRERSLSDCQSLAQHALTLETAAEVRNTSPVR
ncbi:phosphoenolpyruvate--protein phosphotransferase [Corallincola spongiicola]|uniref:phosphoenolpyruvate--protein phosphotransferase n=2 Tax=Corallincola spongiicola TaxID=2520508 RepID=A0ABY1WPR8_9GAMM|nr:phosphoenolpyruvate--protein phosphotransferase [Corallincola spongiicola]